MGENVVPAKREGLMRRSPMTQPITSVSTVPNDTLDSGAIPSGAFRPAHPYAGVAFVAAAVACFAALDSTTKFVSATASVVMVMWARYLFQAVITTATLLPHRGLALLRTRRPLMQLVRALLLLSSSVLAYFSLQVMPVGEFTAIVMITPLVITLLAATSLNERVSATRWLLAAGGFAGAMIVIRPGADMFHWVMLLPLALVAANAGYQVLTSKLVAVDDAGTVQFYTGWVGALVATAALPFAWQSLPAGTWLLMLLLGLLSTVGHLFLILAFHRSPVNVLTPFLYLQIAFAALFGWLLFSHTPDPMSIIGIVIIVLCGAGGTWVPVSKSGAASASD